MFCASVISTGALADEAGVYTFTVLRDGDPVGHYRIAFERSGGHAEVRETIKIIVRLLSIPVYRFDYSGRQVWKDDRAVWVDAVTNRDGEKLHITVRADAGGYVRAVNDRIDRFDASVRVLAFWNKDTLNHHKFVSVVEDKTLEVSFPRVGRENITVAGQQLRAEHYRMVGDEERDLWFDPVGRLAKLEFRRHGSDIAYIRDQIDPLTLEAGCVSRC